MEKHEQIAVIGWASHIPEIRNRLIHIPNGGTRNIREAISLKKQGVKPGVSDLFLPLPRGGYHGMWIEQKFKNGRLTAAQQAWIEDMISLGYAAVVSWSAEETINYLKSYLSLEEKHRV